MAYETEIGDGILYVWDGLFHKLVNTVTGKERVFVTKDGMLCVDDKDIDFEAIERKFGPGEGRDKRVMYRFGHYGNFKNGVCALSWVINPDGMWYADEDGYGMEHGEEQRAFCIINRDLEIIVPFRPEESIDAVIDLYDTF